MTTSLALLILGLAFSVGTAGAQSAKDLVGTWTPVSAEVFGPNPKGNLTFDANGHFSLQLLRADLKKIAANKRDMGTPEENNAIVHEWVKARGFEFFAPKGYRSKSLTCVANNKNVDVPEMLKKLKDKHGFILDGGYGKLKGKTFRISNMGDETPETMRELLTAIDDSLAS